MHHRRAQPKQEPIDLLKAQAAALQQALGTGLRRISTPELGEVEFANVDQIIAALNLINGQIAALEGGGKSRTEPVIALSGLWPVRGELR
jgi:hypothetical protein